MNDYADVIRSRMVTWSDPLSSIGRATAMTGLEMCLAVLEGELPSPPIGELMGIRPVEFVEGRALLAVEPSEFHTNQAGAAHGGLASTVLDSAMWLAIHTTMPAGAFCTTLQVNLHYVRPLIIGGGEVFAEGRVVHRGRKIATAEGLIRDAGDVVLAHGSTSCMVHGLA